MRQQWFVVQLVQFVGQQRRWVMIGHWGVCHGYSRCMVRHSWSVVVGYWGVGIGQSRSCMGDDSWSVGNC